MFYLCPDKNACIFQRMLYYIQPRRKMQAFSLISRKNFYIIFVISLKNDFS
jgi:hypothetical protein